MSANEPDPRAYVRIAAEVRGQIMSGALAPGAPSPSATALAREHGRTRATCARALRLLASEGLLTRYPGLGYYVRQGSSRP